MALITGQIFGNYQVVRLVGEGGFGYNNETGPVAAAKSVAGPASSNFTESR